MALDGPGDDRSPAAPVSEPLRAAHRIIMILTPKVLVLVIATGLFWLVTLVAILLLLAGLSNANASLLTPGLLGSGLALVIGVTFRHNESRIRQWAQR